MNRRVRAIIRAIIMESQLLHIPESSSDTRRGGRDNVQRNNDQPFRTFSEAGVDIVLRFSNHISPL